MAKIVIDTNEFIDILKLNEDEIKQYLKSITRPHFTLHFSATNY